MSYFESGMFKARRGDYEGAIADFEKGLEKNPQDVKLCLAKGFYKAELKSKRAKKAQYIRYSELASGKGRDSSGAGIY